MKRLNYDFKYHIKEDADNPLMIEGYANRAYQKGSKVIDRGKEHIPAKEWKFEEWMENPVILFNHDRNLPIGRGIEVKVTEDGLWLKAAISKSDVPEIRKVRDLIKEKILRSFSVGIDVKDEEQDDDGSISLKGVNLLEASVVTIPMNQASQFNLTTKMLKETNVNEIKTQLTREKGAVLPAMIHQKIGELMESGQDFSRDDALIKIAADAGVAMDDLFEFLAGNMSQVSDDLLTSLGENLSIPKAQLEELAAADTALQGMIIDRAEEQVEEGDEASEEEKEEDEDLEIAEPDEVELSDDVEAEMIEIDDDDELLEEDKADDEDEDEEDKGKAYIVSLSRNIRAAMEAGKEKDQAIAFALSRCEKPAGMRLEVKEWNQIFSILEKSGMPMGPTAPMAPQGYIESSPGDHHLQELRQTNVLLAQLVGEVQTLTSALKANNNMPIVPSQPSVGAVAQMSHRPPKEKQETLDIVAEYHRKLEDRINKLIV